ncbi:2-dehydro-3-deoxyphosphogluconate aldolase [Streptococcus sp. zg-86]|uniref:2-dehydro-3-deoxyphosphogluconate aldolase n=1 Tax=Streptococcus zhangguiae TaxID=2664091 RepID=A0A6I4RIX0_9STRE|nr:MULTISPECIES: bifunctional 4-hydroxy-2-oxoglutarate aldolase/2-dehydro-3-deoxy-phosphogluconate aldolase [unclassified Streptococcus]MTB64750.1 2-dehydro-3-deoxyphosphogluconate aldolase [Streptococcus sp. zg-86]MTB91322.1 2-dehydro-3-deoxyphosphogluconate aldolase [Streptococcus sp. zg-36]MWV56747.1 2-dehydro-3-deoxyphosphogluconate aldolase [Streptococcus sp. zg-70]QTH48479.1 bifunctional 4-hydroxy-2-oxoglutarate aldolase/2-dehydro-3-deoxy-phosphogluconate aldolase [Streptococcus sp. zg-86
MISEFPKLTVILRGYEFEDLDTIMDAIQHEDCAVEVTLNSPDVFNSLEKLVAKYGDKMMIGAGTVLNLDDARKVIDCGVKFLLSPVMLETEVLQLCQENNVISVPAAMTPTEVQALFTKGADIVKVFPANVVGEPFFKGLRGPLGDLPLMAVGGVSIQNVSSFIEAGASYIGVGSALFAQEAVKNKDKVTLVKNVRDFLKRMEVK